MTDLFHYYRFGCNHVCMDHGFAVTFAAAVFRRHAYQCMGTFYTPDNYQLLWCIRIFPDVQQFCFNGMHGCNDWCCRKYTPSGARRPLWNSCRCGCISWGTDSRTACILYKAESWISKDFTYSSFHRYYGSGTLLISCNL